MKEKRKIYIIAPSILLFTILFLTFAFAAHWVSSGIISIEREVISYCLILIFAIIMWSSQIIVLEGDRLLRIYFLIYRKRFLLQDIVSVKVENESGMYGSIRYMKVSFKDGDYLNYYLGTVASTKDFVNRMHEVVLDKIDPAVFEFTNKPY